MYGRVRIVVTAIAILVVLVAAFIVHSAQPPPQVVPPVAPNPAVKEQVSPSGQHFSLTILGKSDNFDCSPGGSVVQIRASSDAEVSYIADDAAEDMYLLDPCALTGHDSAKIRVPAGRFGLYARIPLPDAGEGPAGIVFYPALVNLCREGNPDREGCSEQMLVRLGEIGQVQVSGQTLPGEQDLTNLLRWSGYACEARSDVDRDQEITPEDFENRDLNGDGISDEHDLEFYLQANCQSFEEAWLFDIADLAGYGWDYPTKGTRFVQLLLYPV